ncbi:Rieske 2Fe-2S domain-containing protein [Thalassotalea sp. 1_MG-2023]|uniref:Rieske 2Fe-2S domain-containing protein n=1 Tax=Thalassotalea sp. 1_MG-2023 TaxID=3062680 RepID=UPI0026E22E70|nr:Rieske 2Fe-2S domain-containing protein [Thalassotalea sp. 1_MG-2023]MDO6427313.1 Rieske 2Fe-2S domain-containing protein [Thalassotalea sp. 1_MG-2023]
MNKNELIQYFPCGGVIDHEVPVFDVKPLKQNNAWNAIATLPPANTAKAIIIYCLGEGEEAEYRTIPAKCPHQGADLSHDELKHDGNVYCHLHKRPICVFSEYNYAFNVIKRDNKFVITP